MRPLTVQANWDDEAGVWVATSRDEIGLVTEAETLEALRLKLTELIPELLAENGVPRDVDANAPVEIVARQTLSIRAA